MERFTDLLFLAQVALLFGALSWWLTPARRPGRAMLVITAWVALLGYLSLGGYFANFRSLPPRIFSALLLPLLAGLLFLRLPGARELLARTPPQWPIYAQSFRVVIELILWLLYLQQRRGPRSALHAVPSPRLRHRPASYLRPSRDATRTSWWG